MTSVLLTLQNFVSHRVLFRDKMGFDFIPSAMHQVSRDLVYIENNKNYEIRNSCEYLPFTISDNSFFIFLFVYIGLMVSEQYL